MPFNPFLVQNTIHKRYHKLTLVWSMHVVSCITIRVAVSFVLYSFQIWHIQSSVFNWTCIKHSKCSLCRITHPLMVCCWDCNNNNNNNNNNKFNYLFTVQNCGPRKSVNCAPRRKFFQDEQLTHTQILQCVTGYLM